MIVLFGQQKGAILADSPRFPEFRIDKSSLLIASIAPLLWIVDSFRSAIFLNKSFVQELFFPETSALFLRLWLVFFILIQAWFFNRYSRTQNRVFEVEKKLRSLFELSPDALVVTDIEGRVVEVSGKAVELWGYSFQELSALDLTRLCAANESERLINFIREIIKNKAGGLDNVMLAVKDSLTIPADIKGRLIDNLDVQDKPGIFLDITRRKSLEQSAAATVAALEVPVKKPAPEIPPVKKELEIPALKLEEERSRIEEAVRQVESKKSQEALKNLEQKYLELMRLRLSEEKKKAEEQIRELESKVSASSQAIEEKLNQERGRIEEAIKQEEAKKSREQADGLEQKYSEILKARVAEARQQAEEMIRLEEKKKSEEMLRQAEAKFAAESGAKISEGRKLIEDSVRQEEQRKAAESAAGLKREFEELLRKGIEEERKRGEEAAKEERGRMEESIRQMSAERGRMEAAVRKEEQEKALEAFNDLKLKYEESLPKAIADERRRGEEAAKQALSQLEETIRKMSEERVRAEEAIRREEKKKREDDLRACEEAARKATEENKKAKVEVKPPEIGKLVSGVGQQMLNPLSAVLNYLKVIKIKITQGSELKPQEFKDTIGLIEENALLCKNILSSLADPSRVAKTTFQTVSLNDVIAKIDALLGQELRLQNITVSKALQANLANISGDPLLLTQVVFNLISNAKWAIKSNPYAGGGTLVIKTQSNANKDSVELLITDNGAGIPAKDQPRIFDPFFTTKADGLGLGLTIALSIVKEHKGEIQVESKEGIGSTFKLIFPALS